MTDTKDVMQMDLLGGPEVPLSSLDPDAQAHARTTDPATSHAAAASITPDKLRESQRVVLAFLKVRGPMTDTDLVELWQHYRLREWNDQSPSGLRTRRRELVAAGLVRDTGRRQRLDTGRKAIIWEAVS